MVLCTHARTARYSAHMALELPRTLRGALAGAAAAGVWAAQQPLDKRVFGVPNDDAQLLGTAVVRGRAEMPVGTAMHVVNGALFGAVYANVAPALPVPPWARGPEHSSHHRRLTTCLWQILLQIYLLILVSCSLPPLCIEFFLRYNMYIIFLLTYK